jgi:ribonuclease HI
MDITIFTDGACTNNGSMKAEAGIGIYFPNNEYENISEPFTISPITNQRAELYAIYTALIKISQNNQYRKIIIYSDSLYSIKSLTIWIEKWKLNHWKTVNKKPVKNLDLILPIYELMQRNKDKIIFKHVKAHTNGSDLESIGNEKADGLATSAHK